MSLQVSSGEDCGVDMEKYLHGLVHRLFHLVEHSRVFKDICDVVFFGVSRMTEIGCSSVAEVVDKQLPVDVCADWMHRMDIVYGRYRGEEPLSVYDEFVIWFCSYEQRIASGLNRYHFADTGLYETDILSEWKRLRQMFFQ